MACDVETAVSAEAAAGIGGPGTSTRPFVNWVVVVRLEAVVLVAVGAEEEEELAVSKTGNHVTMSGTVKS